MNYGELSLLLKTQLQQLYESGEAKAIADLYLESKTGMNASQLHISSLEIVQEEFVIESYHDLKRLMAAEPIQYVLGFQWFCDKKFIVNDSVLIPRPETEELVEMIIDTHKDSVNRIIDIGTGSGCIPVCIKMRIPESEVMATDISREALRVAKLNAETYQTEILFIEDDISNTAIDSSEKFDIVISNPPYIPQGSHHQLDANVVDYEPGTALFVPDENPLYFYKVIGQFAVERLKQNGILYFEIHKNTGAQIKLLLESYDFKQVTVLNDLSNNERFITARKD